MSAFLVTGNHIFNGSLGRLLRSFARSHHSFHSLAPQRSALLRSFRSLHSWARSLTHLTHSLVGRLIFMLKSRFMKQPRFLISSHHFLSCHHCIDASNSRCRRQSSHSQPRNTNPWPPQRSTPSEQLTRCPPIDLSGQYFNVLIVPWSFNVSIRWSVVASLMLNFIWGFGRFGVGLGWGWGLDAPTHPSKTIFLTNLSLPPPMSYRWIEPAPQIITPAHFVGLWLNHFDLFDRPPPVIPGQEIIQDLPR